MPSVVPVARTFFVWSCTQPVGLSSTGSSGVSTDDRLTLAGTFLVSVYGGCFGGAHCVVLIAVLMLTSPDEVRRLNALKN